MKILSGAVLAGLVCAVGCGGSSRTGGATCATFESEMRACNLLGPGELDCEEPTEPVERCEAACVLGSSCGDLRELFCEGSLSSTLGTCLQTCEQKHGFQCDNGSTTIRDDEKCDGYEDCEDASDEVGCPTITCGDGTSLSAALECDGYQDCEDASDEANCTGKLFQCANGIQLPADWECDGEPDCEDGSDEVNCTGPPPANIVCD